MKIVGPTIVGLGGSGSRRHHAAGRPATSSTSCAASRCSTGLRLRQLPLRRLPRAARARARPARSGSQTLARDTGLAIRPEAVAPSTRCDNLQGIDVERSAVAHRPGDPVDGSPPDDRRVRRGRGHHCPCRTSPPSSQGDALRVAVAGDRLHHGQPPFQGSAAHQRSLSETSYVDWLKSEFGVGMKDFCTYWFRRARGPPANRDSGPDWSAPTRSHRTSGRSASLEYVDARGGVITDAVSSQSCHRASP